MKQLFYIMGLIFAINNIKAQLTNTENYISKKTYLDYPTLGTPKVAQTVEYIDGLGRSKQTVNVRSTPSGKDLVSLQDYDKFGREVKKYLPLPQQGTQNGSIYSNPLSVGTNFYNNEKVYRETIFENSPLNRVLKEAPEGWEWQGRSVNYFESQNDLADNVQNFLTNTSIVNNSIRTKITDKTKYSAGELYKKKTCNEDGACTTEFTNGKGQLVLSRKGSFSSTESDTYYLYNDYGQLAWIIPPIIAERQVFTDEELNKFAYEYRYDGRGRQVEKKLPGKDVEYMVYDKHDRLILKQDINLRIKGQWLFTKYDTWDRIVYTGITSSTLSRIDMQAFIDGYSGPTSETRGGNFQASNRGVQYTNDAFPTNIADLLIVNYYDSRPYYDSFNDFPSFIMDQKVLVTNQQEKANGLLLTTFVKNIENDDWSETNIIYDTRGKEIATYSGSSLRGLTKKEQKLNFAGLPVKIVTSHTKAKNIAPDIITETFEYDQQNRLSKHWHQVNSEPVELLTENKYNEISQVVRKIVGNGLQTIDYGYNIRGWQTQINDPENLNGKLFGYKIKYEKPYDAQPKYNGNISQIDWKTADDGILRRYSYHYDNLDRLHLGDYSEPNSTMPANKAFNEELFYDLNGNITTLKRNAYVQNVGVQEIDFLSYTYNGNQVTNIVDNNYNYMGYPESAGTEILYDKNGNMISHEDKGIKEIGYNYLNLPNTVKFNKLYQPHNDPNGLEPAVTKYVYGADGKKLRKIYTYGSGPSNLETTKVSDYIDGFQYTDNVLSFVPTAEGYYDFVQKKYVYQYADQVGNVRVSYYKGPSGSPIIDRVTNYYPFGLEFNENIVPYNSISPNYRYTTQKQEKQEDTGWSSFKWRNYDPTIGRFFNVDPLSEKYAYQSHYNFSENRVVDAREIEGLESLPMNASKVYEHRQKSADILEEQGRVGEAAVLRQKADLIQEINTLIISAPIFEIEEVILTVRATQGVGFFGRAWNAIKGIFTGAEASAGIAETTAGKVPNPYGKNGGPLHQQKIKDVETELTAEGFTKIEKEVKVPTPDGSKSKRFIDVQGTNPKTGEVRQVQVGKQNKNGTPVSRERKALDDIEQATGTRPEFVPYNKVQPKIKIRKDELEY
ncbi:hypothetical protein BBI01_01175 [Chryseobacterium artocarpi]|uniref:DUF6443 domain-containing protein n=1 Tax=Chryseobacterium artocarpi TaxID=1414727 RepID=A0A1B8ZZU3_9FLAO|nr:DUF6443 domain-containing protein [Chryseobacterium artocarpi]OCA77103.1 hypothetical protein BBI01_01175 [Chryseobacterium artocarpi]